MKKKIIFGLIAVIVAWSAYTVLNRECNGIDVSHHNGKIEWEKVNKEVKFVYIKATEGKSFKDPKFEYNFTNAQRQGLKVGVYHFYREEVPAAKQFRWFKKVVAPYRQDLIPVIDVEACKSRKAVAKTLPELCQLFEKEYGQKPIVYTNLPTYLYFMPSAAKECKIWGSWKSPLPDMYPKTLSIIQYSEYGEISGIPTDVDINQCKNMEDILIM